MTEDEIEDVEIEESEVEKIENIKTRIYNDKTSDELSTTQFMKAIGKYSRVLSADEEKELAFKVATGHPDKEKCKTKLFLHNIRLVLHIAKKYNGKGLPFMDLVQEGCIGLLKSIDKFEPGRGNRLSTFASNWIRQSVTRALADKSRNIRVPVHMHDLLNSYLKHVRVLAYNLQRMPSKSEIAAIMGLSEEKITAFALLLELPLSLDHSIKEIDNVDLKDTLIDNGELPDKQVMRSETRDYLEGLILNLTPKQRTYTRLRYGFFDGIPRRKEEIAEYMNISNERVRQLDFQVIKKLRQRLQGKSLEEFTIV